MVCNKLTKAEFRKWTADEQDNISTMVVRHLRELSIITKIPIDDLGKKYNEFIRIQEKTHKEEQHPQAGVLYYKWPLQELLAYATNEPPAKVRAAWEEGEKQNPLTAPDQLGLWEQDRVRSARIFRHLLAAIVKVPYSTLRETLIEGIKTFICEEEQATRKEIT